MSSRDKWPVHILFQSVPANFTYLSQPLDVQGGSNGFVKRIMKRKFTDWYASQVALAMEEGEELETIEVPRKLSHIKPLKRMEGVRNQGNSWTRSVTMPLPVHRHRSNGGKWLRYTDHQCTCDFRSLKICKRMWMWRGNWKWFWLRGVNWWKPARWWPEECIFDLFDDEEDLWTYILLWYDGK